MTDSLGWVQFLNLLLPLVLGGLMALHRSFKNEIRVLHNRISKRDDAIKDLRKELHGLAVEVAKWSVKRE